MSKFMRRNMDATACQVNARSGSVPSDGERDGVRGQFMEGKHAQFPEFSRPLVLELLHGDSRRLLQGTSIFTTRLSQHRALTRRSVDSRRFAQFADVPRVPRVR